MKTQSLALFKSICHKVISVHLSHNNDYLEKFPTSLSFLP